MSYPEKLSFEIDRARLTRYWRVAGLVRTLICVSLIVVLVGGNLGAERISAAVDNEMGQGIDIGGTMFEAFRLCIALGIGLSLVLYAVFVHFPSSWRAQNLKLSVEGTYLCLRTGWLCQQDRRIHFRAVADYSTQDGPILRIFGLRALGLSVSGPNVVVPGILDVENVRDALCELDAEREQ